MLTPLRRLITIKLGIIGLSILLVQCAWIKGGPSEPEIVTRMDLGIANYCGCKSIEISGNRELYSRRLRQADIAKYKNYRHHYGLRG